MTTETTGSYKCPLCNKLSRHKIIMSTNEFGSCDLDTRPAEMRRSTMHTWVQECPHCGYAASKLTDTPEVDAAFLQTPEYLSYGGIAFGSELAKKFYRLYLIKRHAKDARNAYFSALEAAWASDDAKDDESAVACRNLAIEPLEEWIEEEPENEHLKLMKFDVLRRARRFDEMLQYAEEVAFEDAFLRGIANFAVELAKKQDAACYTVADVPE